MTTTMATTATPASLGLVVRASVIAAAISALVHVALGSAFRTGLGIDPMFAPLSPTAIIAFTVALTLVGGAVFAVIADRWPTDAVRCFTIVAVVVATVSPGAPLSLLGASPAQWPGVSTLAALALMPLHMVAATVLAAPSEGPRQLSGRGRSAAGGCERRPCTPERSG
jgi:uncharacterized protein DUF6069